MGRVIEVPVAEVREGGVERLGEGVGAIGGAARGSGIDRGHSGELGLIGRPAGEGVGDAAAPLEDESDGGKGKREESEEEEEARGGGWWLVLELSVGKSTRHRWNCEGSKWWKAHVMRYDEMRMLSFI